MVVFTALFVLFVLLVPFVLFVLFVLLVELLTLLVLLEFVASSDSLMSIRVISDPVSCSAFSRKRLPGEISKILAAPLCSKNANAVLSAAKSSPGRTVSRYTSA
ncbi:hypothetical protein D3C74_380780 [compost metagenome]